MQLTGSHADLAAAHQFFTPGHAAIGTPIMGHALIGAPAIPGTIMPVIPGAAEPISPLIQLIMRLPGHIGLFNSFFEALGNFFLPHLHALGFDPAIFDLHAHVASITAHLPSAEHFSIDHSLLPHDASILHGDLAHGVAEGHSSMLQHSEPSEITDPTKVSSEIDPRNAQFEGSHSAASGKAGELLSGPSMSNNPIGNHLAGTQRLFSDRFQGSLFAKPGAPSNLLTNVASSTGVSTPLGNVASSTNALNVGSSTFAAQPQALPAVSQVNDAVSSAAPAGSLLDGSHLGAGSSNGLGDGSLGPGADRQLLASNQVGDTFHPASSGSTLDSSSQSSSMAEAYNRAHSAVSGSPTQGMKAQELSLDSVKSGAHPSVAHGAQHSLLKPAAQSNAAAAKPVAHSANGTRVGSESNSVTAEHAQPAHAEHAQNAHPDHAQAAHADHAQSAHSAASDHGQSNQHVANDHGVHNVTAEHSASTHTAPSEHAHSSSHDAVATNAHAEHMPHHGDLLEGTKTAAKEIAHAAPKHSSMPEVDAPTRDLTKLASADPATSSQVQPSASSTSSQLQSNSYTIRAGDNLWSIAKNHLGSAMKWQDVYKMNQNVLGSNPNMLHTGSTIKLPGMDLANNSIANNNIASAGAEATKYVVKPGDCLWNIAKDQLHDATKWNDLFKANTDVIGANPRFIAPGQELTIPGDSSALIASAPGTSAIGSAGVEQIAQSTGQITPSADFGNPVTADGAPQFAPAEQMEFQPPAMQQAIPTPSAPQFQAPAPGHAPTSLQNLIPTMHGPGASLPSPVHFGNGAASAATLGSAPPIPRSPVSSSLGSDLANFLSQRK